MVVFAVLLGASFVSEHIEGTPAWPPDGRVVGVLAGIAVFALLARRVQASWPVVARPVALAVVGVVAVVIAGAGWFVQREYAQRRYVATGLATEPADEYFRTTRGLRVAAFGGNEIFGMFGAALANDVRKLESLGAGRDTCAEWRRVLDGFDRIVIVPGYGLHYLPPLEWFTNEPHVRIERREGPNVVLRVDGPLPASGCAVR
jgi:hypothetical protein